MFQRFFGRLDVPTAVSTPEATPQQTLDQMREAEELVQAAHLARRVPHGSNIRPEVLAQLSPEELDFIVREAFHLAWSNAHGRPNYNKQSWCYVQQFVDPAFRNQSTAKVYTFSPDPDNR